VSAVDLVVHGPHALAMAGEGGYRADVALAIDRGWIVAIGPRVEVLGGYPAEGTIGARPPDPGGPD
jgi:hypothetical protein